MLSAFNLSHVTGTQLCRQLCAGIIFYNPISSRPPRQQGDPRQFSSHSKARCSEVRQLGVWKEGRKGQGERREVKQYSGRGEGGCSELGRTKNERGREGRTTHALPPHGIAAAVRSLSSAGGPDMRRARVPFCPGEKVVRGLCLHPPSSPGV